MDWGTIWIFLQQGIASGLVTGSIYALLALSLAIVFKTTDVPNFAQGELFMLGSYVALFLLMFTAVSYTLALVITIGVCFFGGAAFFWVVLRRAVAVAPKGNVVNLVITTLGLSFLLKGLVRQTGFGGIPRSFPSLFSTDVIVIGDAVLTHQDVAIFVMSLLAMATFFAFFNYTRPGRAMRAVGMNPRAAELVGINLSRTRMTAWGMSAALSALAAVLIAPKILMTADMGSVVIVAFAAAIVGGFTSLPGAVIGGMLIGILENLVGLFVSSSAIVVTPFVVIMLVLVLRPQGILGGRVAVKKV